MSEQLERTILIHPGSKTFTVVIDFNGEGFEIPSGWEISELSSEELQKEGYKSVPFAGLLLT